ncbi:hypothetical protein L227DRAFT_533745 [Lentinus tigrinus ALCF2SS1-6]|uniref:Fungal-type protein kinase domain-containing protein n=1 Tax=Lentinus tigrinus ALCF2SS1-6 TaxID=1328759 RepID=A0A5C2RW92_9APHY|nr:hypothetical protein L227DRAFT_533745 [Lentinus tigrinus ALCF2SS1-6]
MPNSTRSLANLTSYAGGLDALADSPQVIAAWNSELHHRVHVYHKDSIEEFLDLFVPCSEPYRPAGDVLDGVFSAYKPQKGGEVASYPSLTAGLDDLVSSFPEPYKLSFADTHSAQWRFPFTAFAKHHSKSSPDVSVSFPGKKFADQITWSDVSMVIEVKPTEGEDPFPSWKLGSTHNGTVTQVARNARNMLLTHGFLQTFVVGIYANSVRIARFDHTSGVVSQTFNLQQHPDLLQRFFWHFTHPLVGDTIVGCDPTAYPLTLHDHVWIRKELFGAGVANVPAELSEITKGRRVKVYNERTKEDDWYLLIRLLDVNARLLSRATAVWLAVQDNREYNGDEPIHPLLPSGTSHGEEEHLPEEEIVEGSRAEDAPTDEAKDARMDEGKEVPVDKKKPDDEKARPKVRVLKEAWRQVVRTPESAFYERLDACIPDDVRWGLPKWVCGTDLGAREVRDWEDASPPATVSHYLDDTRHLRLGLPPDSLDPPTHLASRPSTPTPLSPGDADAAPLGNIPFTTIPVTLAKTTASLSPSTPFPQHQTFTWALSRGTPYTYRERSHMRFVVDNVGRPITEFKDTKELVLAMRDAIMGHRQAWEMAGVLHRDISVGNILIVDEPEPNSFKGFIHDFDYSSMTDTPPVKNEEPLDEQAAQVPAEDALAAMEDALLAAQKERTGTFYFMALELLSSACMLHEVHHDLESFCWVLLWVILRHTNHNLGQQYCTTVFKYGSDDEAVNGKVGWLGFERREQRASQRLTIKNNVPLTDMMYKLRTMVRRSAHGFDILTYDSLLEVFNEALAKDGWPANDRVECTLTDQVVDSVVSPFQFAPDHFAPHVVTAPPATRAQVILRAFRDSMARGKEREANTVAQVEQAIKKRKERGRSLSQVEVMEKALHERSPDAKRRRGPGPC